MSGFERTLDELLDARGAALDARRRLRRGRARAPLGAAPARRARRRHRPRGGVDPGGLGRSARRPTSNTARCRPRTLPFADDEFDLASAIEVLEHVPDPERTLAEMARCAARHLLVSVPREPLWRMLNMARGAYLRELGNTPGHLNHWSGARFARLLARHGEVVEVRSPFPWTMVLVRPLDVEPPAANGRSDRQRSYGRGARDPLDRDRLRPGC